MDGLPEPEQEERDGSKSQRGLEGWEGSGGGSSGGGGWRDRRREAERGRGHGTEECGTHRKEMRS